MFRHVISVGAVEDSDTSLKHASCGISYAPSSDCAFDFDIPGFSVGSFLRDHIAVLLIAAVCVLMVAGMMAAIGVSADARTLIVGVIVVCFIAGMTVEYLRRKKYYAKLSEGMDCIGRASHFASLADSPAFLDGRIGYEALAGLGRMAGIETARVNADSQDYRDYIELWVHEVKTPLAAASLVLAQMHGEEADKLARELERAERQIEQALYYARSTSLGNDYELSLVSLHDVANVACKKSRRFLIENGVGIKNDIPQDYVVISDKTWLVFALDQILTNSAKYGASEIVLSAEEEELGTSREHTLLSISDNGCGIAASDLPRVFDRAFTGANGRNRGNATGMGLYLVAMLVERMGLSVAIASEEGVGTRVTISFPHDLERMQMERSG